MSRIAFNDPIVDCCERDAADCDCRYIVEPHTSRMTGMYWFIVKDVDTGSKAEGTVFFDTYSSAVNEARRLNGVTEPYIHPEEE